MRAVDTRVDLAERPELRDARDGGGLDRRLQELPEGHPSSPGYAEAARGIDSGGDDGERIDADRIRPLTDAEHADHVADIKARLDHARAAGMATDCQHTLDPGREVWSKERRALHDLIISDLYSAASDAPCEREAVLAGGLPGAGKTTVLHGCADIDVERYLMINPDVIKQELARRGLVPEVAGLSPMEAADLVHEESSHIAKRLAHRAESDGRNVIWDVTMSSPASAEKRIDSLRASGYARIDGIFVDIPVEVSLRRADARHREGHDKYGVGQWLGGRFVPAETILDHADREWGSQNRRNFEALKARFDGWAQYDNSVDDASPLLVESRANRGVKERLNEH